MKLGEFERVFNMNNEKYFEGFTLPVPLAFADALDKCLFEQGDLIYSDHVAYEKPWGEALEELKFSIQVEKPARGVGIVASMGDDGIFEENWRSAVVFNLKNYADDTVNAVSTSQGALYTLLRTGDLNAINDECLPIPVGAMEADKMLENILSGYNTAGASIFAFFASRVNSRHTMKIEGLKRAFVNIHDIERMPVAQLEEFKSLNPSPTLELVIFKINADVQEVECRVKSLLYRPSRDKKTGKEMFRIRAHGYLLGVKSIR